MCLSGAAGRRGRRGADPPGRRRPHRIVPRRGAALGKLLLACALLLVGAGLIEGFVSPDPSFPLWSRVTIGVGYWLVMVGLLSGWLFGRGRAAA